MGKMVWWMKLLPAVILISSSYVYGARILFLAPVATKSHNTFYLPIAEELAERGHEVTYASGFALNANKTDVVKLPIRPGHEVDIRPKILNFSVSVMLTNILLWTEHCLDALQTKEAQELLQEKWDVVLISVFFNDCFLYQVNKMQVPYIWLVPNGLFEPYAHLAGAPMFPSFMSNPINPLVSGSPPYSFLQRTANTLFNIWGVLMYDYYYLPRVDSSCRSRGLCNEDDPIVRDLRLNSSLVIINSIRAIENSAAPYPPSVVHAGGIHLKTAKPLPQELEEFVSGSGDAGFIFFSLGSVLRTEDMPQHIFELLVKVFSCLPQRVLWKWDTDTPLNLPSNIRMGNWLPQQDLLGHSSIRLFITHGGLHSTMEAAHHGVPIIGMPVFGDQKSNMNQVEGRGFGRMLLWEDFTEDWMLSLIDDIIKDKRMKQATVKQAVLMNDLPMSSKDTAAYWVEYIIRHNGAPHLRCPARQMPWYRLYNVDVWGTLVLSVIFAMFLTYKIFKTCFNYIFRAKKIKSE